MTAPRLQGHPSRPSTNTPLFHSGFGRPHRFGELVFIPAIIWISPSSISVQTSPADLSNSDINYPNYKRSSEEPRQCTRLGSSVQGHIRTPWALHPGRQGEGHFMAVAPDLGLGGSFGNSGMPPLITHVPPTHPCPSALCAL